MEYNICKILGNNVKRYRNLKGLSQEKFAELIGIGVTSLSLIERGKGFVTAKTLEKISSVLNISVPVLMSNCDICDERILYDEIKLKIEHLENNKDKLTLLYEYLKVLT